MSERVEQKANAEAEEASRTSMKPEVSSLSEAGESSQPSMVPDVSSLSLSPALLETAVLGQTILPPGEELSQTFAVRLEDAGELPRLTLKDADSLDAQLRIVSKLGQGGMGVVHLAHQKALAREVAIKRLRPGRQTQEDVASLLREARIVGGLEHPNIIPVYALGVEQDGQPVLVMKRVEGVMWKTLIQDPGHPRWERTKVEPLAFHLGVLQKVCDAVDFAHSKGFLHRDLKAENVMVGAYGEVYVLDWGIAWPVDGPVPEAVAGTPGFMAPEMIELEPLTVQTDVFLLGALLHELLTGAPRFAGKILAEVMLKSVNALPAQFPPSVPAELAEICNKATRREPDERYPSALAFREAIDGFLAHRSAMELVDLGLGLLAHLKAECAAILASGEGDGVGQGSGVVRGERSGESDVKGVPEGAEEWAWPSSAVSSRGSIPLPVASSPQERVRALFAEAQLAFRGALRIWPESTAAQEGLADLLRAMVGFEIGQGQLTTARGLFAQLDAPDEALAVRLRVLEEAHNAEQARIGALEALARDRDPRISARLRAWIYGSLLVLSGCVGLLPVLGVRTGRLLSYPSLLTLVVVLIVVWGALVVLVHVRSSHHLTRQTATAIFLACWMYLGVGALGWSQGVSLRTIIQLYLMMTALSVATMAVFSRLVYMWGALFLLLGVVGSLCWPSFWFTWLTGSVAFLYVCLIVLEIATIRAQ